MSYFKKVVAALASVLIFSISGAGQAQADQSMTIDLNSFNPDSTIGVDGITLPVYYFYGVADGEIVTINVQNSTKGFIGYINNSTGNSININNGAGLNVSNNTGQFIGFGNLSSLAYDTAITGSYTATIAFGTPALLDRTIGIENGLANSVGGSTNNALGLLLLEWGGQAVAETKQISFYNNGAPRATVIRSGNALRLDAAGTTSEKSNVVSCTPGKYTYLNGGSTPETANIQSYVYTLLVNGTAVSTLSSDGFKSVAAHMFPTVPNNMTGTATLDGATWDLKEMSNYSAQCQVYATQSGGNIQSVTSITHDAVALTAAAELAANAQATKDMISNWAATYEALAKKTRDARLAGKP